jgi:hypothetical protein
MWILTFSPGDFFDRELILVLDSWRMSFVYTYTEDKHYACM